VGKQGTGTDRRSISGLPKREVPAFARGWEIAPYYSTKGGFALLGNSLKLMKQLPDASVNLIMTSPPYALQKQKAYGNVGQDAYVRWFRKFIPEFKRLLAEDGSLVVNIGGAWEPGRPTRSLYHYKLLLSLVKNDNLYLAQDFFWLNTAKMPYPYEWVSQKRTRVKDAVEPVWWLSKTPNPKADNRRVLQPYSKSMEYMMKRGHYNGGVRPSGSVVHETSWLKNNGGAIPPNFSPPTPETPDVVNVLMVANTESNSRYQRMCRENANRGFRVHPARFPRNLPEFFINFLTEKGDVVLDPFAGSNLTGEVAEAAGRKWIAMELDELYLRSSAWRFDEFLHNPPELPPIQEPTQDA
jgi:site-specific DNA-methyltransferase (cytosine-N4-specific)